MVFSSTTDEHDIQRHHALTALIQQEADRRPPLSFARFMELALYAPNLGFYEQRGKVIGREGDFFTSVSTGSLFGELLACQFAQWLENLPARQPVIVETGAHDGRLALDILTALRKSSKPVARNIRYWLMEPSKIRQAWQRETLKDFPEHVRWFESWTELSSFCGQNTQKLTGIIFANELLDALPIHRLRWNQEKRKWLELGVVFRNARFEWEAGELSQPALRFAATIRSLSRNRTADLLWPDLPGPLLDVLPDGFVVEICPEALSWWTDAANALASGWLLTLDYGLNAHEFFQPHRHEGTARAYFQHKTSGDLLAEPGRQDLTSHVNFSAVQLAGEAAGLQTESLVSQAAFLTRSLAVLQALEPSTLAPDRVRQFQTLTHPNHLGRSFRVLTQSRGITAEP